jgi:hypothetical protein
LRSRVKDFTARVTSEAVSLAVPAVGGKPARIVVREFERYFTDRWIGEVRAGATRRRRVVEERLVYTAFFNL